MLRKTTSLTLVFSGIFVLLTSVVLYVEPHGRVAYWADWRFWGLSKGDWDGMHITTGFLFLVAMLLHIWLNWKPVLNYLKNKAMQITGATPANIVALLITLYVGFGTLFGLPPMQQVLDVGEHFKESHIATLGSPPYGHAELSSLERFAGYMKLEADTALAALRKAGLTVESVKSVMLDIAKKNNTTPKHLLEIIKESAPAFVPEQAPEGTGRLKFSELCSQLGLDAAAAAMGLEKRGFIIDRDKAMRENAAANNTDAMALYQALRAWSESPSKGARK